MSDNHEKTARESQFSSNYDPKSTFVDLFISYFLSPARGMFRFGDMASGVSFQDLFFMFMSILVFIQPHILSRQSWGNQEVSSFSPLPYAERNCS